MKLENMFDSYRPIISQDEQRFYTVGDLEYLTAGALYGDMDRFYDFKESGCQLHIHEDSKKGMTGANIKAYGEGSGKGIKIDWQNALETEAYAIKMNIPKINIGS